MGDEPFCQLCLFNCNAIVYSGTHQHNLSVRAVIGAVAVVALVLSIAVAHGRDSEFCRGTCVVCLSQQTTDVKVDADGCSVD